MTGPARRRARASVPGPSRLAAGLLLVIASVTGCAGPSPVDSGMPARTPDPTAPPAPSAPSASAARPGSTAPATTAPAGDCDPELTYAPPATLPAPAQFPPGSRLAKIRTRGRIIAGVTSDVLFFGNRDPRTHTIEGFDVEMVRVLSQAIFGRPDRVEFKVFPPAKRIPYLEDGTVDVVARTMTVTCERWREVDFSAVYLRARSAMLTRASARWKAPADALTAGARVCGSAGSTGVAETRRRIAELNAAKARMVEVESLTDCMALFLDERVDALVSDDVLLAGLKDQDPLASVVLTEPDPVVKPIALGLPKDPAFTGYVNGALAAARADGRWTAAYRRWLTTTGADSTPPAPTYGRRP